MNKPIVEGIALYKTFEEAGLRVEVLKNINLQVQMGEWIAIVGASGSGKSTLLHLLGGLDEPTTGEVKIEGHCLINLSEEKKGILRNQTLGFVYQFHHLLPEFTALENVAMPFWIVGKDREEAKHHASFFLKKVGLSKREQHKPSELSGGERQRVAIARAMVTRPKCIMADEPTGNLDRKTAHGVLDTLLELHQETNTSLIMVTHDETIQSRMHTCYHLNEGVLERV